MNWIDGVPRKPSSEESAGGASARPGAVVAVRPPEEREYARRLRQIAIRERRIAALRTELADLRGGLAAFEGVCHARVGDLLAELRRLAEAAADYERRLRRLHLDDEAVDEEEPPPFGRDGSDADAAEADGDPDGRGAGRDRRQGEETSGDRATGLRAALRRLPAAQLAEAKRVYLDLAKRCHPDRAVDDADRYRRQELMLRVNEAWRHRDLDALHALRREADGTDPGFAARPVAERLRWAIAEVERLDDQLVDLRAELILLRGGESHRLWRRHEAGEPVIDRLEADLERRLSKEGRRLDALIAAYRRLHDERRRGRPPATPAAAAPASAAD